MMNYSLIIYEIDGDNRQNSTMPIWNFQGQMRLSKKRAHFLEKGQTE